MKAFLSSGVCNCSNSVCSAATFSSHSLGDLDSILNYENHDDSLRVMISESMPRATSFFRAISSGEYVVRPVRLMP